MKEKKGEAVNQALRTKESMSGNEVTHLRSFIPHIPIRGVDEPPNSDNQEAKKNLDLKRKFYIQNGRSVARQNQIKGRRLLDAIKCNRLRILLSEGYRRSQGGMFSK